ncbi:unnamed protein product [Bursaphelenchus okinawaensis]|uniref:Uncharacterized protein n=1 Tax=Bursaphelenchus okinawaensis TaxID=465554 RepID=A0A811JZU8_9BILA|nr:unnamed protein product [Bursaphelenchus okinawaensis]CAG9088554.1 unnamed protein product [Bursaphelenchus okinawaensis]
MGFVHTDEYYRCCCMKHVHKGCFVIGVIGLVLATITAVCTFMDGLILLGIGAAIHAFCYLLLLIGNRKRIHKLFLPVLVVGIIAIIVYAVFVTLQIISLVQLFQESPATENEHEYSNRLSLLIINLVFTVLSLLFSLYAFYVIYRDYWYLRDEPKKYLHNPQKVVTEVSVIQRTPDNVMEYCYSMACQFDSMKDLWSEPQVGAIWDEEKLGKKKEVLKDHGDVEEEDKTHLLLPNFMAEELSCQKNFSVGTATSTSCYRPPRSIGDHPTFFQPKPLKPTVSVEPASPQVLPVESASPEEVTVEPSNVESELRDIWNDGPLMTSTPRLSAFNYVPGAFQSNYSNFEHEACSNDDGYGNLKNGGYGSDRNDRCNRLININGGGYDGYSNLHGNVYSNFKQPDYSNLKSADYKDLNNGYSILNQGKFLPNYCNFQQKTPNGYCNNLRGYNYGSTCTSNTYSTAGELTTSSSKPEIYSYFDKFNNCQNQKLLQRHQLYQLDQEFGQFGQYSQPGQQNQMSALESQLSFEQWCTTQSKLSQLDQLKSQNMKVANGSIFGQPSHSTPIFQPSLMEPALYQSSSIYRPNDVFNSGFGKREPVGQKTVPLGTPFEKIPQLNQGVPLGPFNLQSGLFGQSINQSVPYGKNGSYSKYSVPNRQSTNHGVPPRYIPYLRTSNVTTPTSHLNTEQQQGSISRSKMVYIEKFGGFGGNCGEFTEPSGVCVNPRTKDIIIADTNNHRIQVFDQHGKFKFMFGKCGRWEGQFMYPNRVAIDPATESYVVSERSPTHQIQIYDAKGRFQRRFGSDLLCNPRGLCVDSQSRVVVVECKVMRIVIYDINGRLLNLITCGNHLNFPNNVCVSKDYEIFISDNGDHCVKVFNYSGQFLRRVGGPGLTNYPIAVAITPLNQVVVVDNHNNFNVTVFSLEGQLIDAYESKVKHAQCLDAALTQHNTVIMCSKDFRTYIYRLGQSGDFDGKCQMCGYIGCGHQQPAQLLTARGSPVNPSTPSTLPSTVQEDQKNIRRLEIKASAEEESERLRRFFIEITIPDN